jgi:hypothetical protein
MWVDNGAEIGQCWICAVLWQPFWKWRPVEIFQCWESIKDIIIYTHIKFWWYRTMLNFCGIVDISYVDRLSCPELIPDIEKFLPVAIFKMATTILHKFNIFRFQRPELIPDIEKFLPVSIFNMAATIPQKFNIVLFQR